MIKLIQFAPKPEMGAWLKRKAEQGCRSVASVVREIVQEKMKSEAKGVNKDDKGVDQ